MVTLKVQHNFVFRRVAGGTPLLLLYVGRKTLRSLDSSVIYRDERPQPNNENFPVLRTVVGRIIM